jgi:hypothetical protein
METWPDFPLVYEVNTRVWLAELARRCGRSVTLANVPDEVFQSWRDRRFDAVWLMGVWQPSEYSRQLALADSALVASFSRALPDWTSQDIASSPYAIAGDRVADSLGGNHALAVFREKLRVHSIKLMLDFVPNHTAVEHPWVSTNPHFYIEVPAEGGGVDPGATFLSPAGKRFACGRLLRCPPWTDTLQLNLGNPELRRALIDTLLAIALQCDGVRCDTAITALKDVFHCSWHQFTGDVDAEFWDATIAEVKRAFPGFIFLAEVYGEHEWRLQQLGFDFTYDKTLYDRLAAREIMGVRQHLAAEWAFTKGLARFTENHDWARASEVFGLNSRAATLLTLFLPGLRIVHDGQIEARRTQLPVYLIRRPEETRDQESEAFYDRLFAVLAAALRGGESRVLDLANETVIGVTRHHPASKTTFCLVNLREADAEIAFPTDAFSRISDYRDVHVVTTELRRSPQFDLWPGGITVRLRGHEGLVLVSRQ